MLRFPCLAGLTLLATALPTQAAEPPSPPAAAPVAIERPALPEHSQLKAQALAMRLKADEQQTLQAEQDDFLALWRPANSGEPKGVVILIPGEQQSADSAGTIGPLRRQLPDAGWHSLSLSLPDPVSSLPSRAPAMPAPTEDASPAPTPAATNALEKGAALPVEQAQASQESEAAQPASEPSPPPAVAGITREAHAARVLARIAAGVAFAQQQQASSLVLLGQGSGAYWAARYLQQNPAPEVQRLLWIGAELPPEPDASWQSLLTDLALPIGDLYPADSPAATQAARERLHASQRLKQDDYKQVALAAVPGNPALEQELLLRRVKGWLSPRAVGAAP